MDEALAFGFARAGLIVKDQVGAARLDERANACLPHTLLALRNRDARRAAQSQNR